MPTVPAALAPYVASLVAYDVDAGGPGTHRGLPSTALSVVLPVGEPLDLGWADDPAGRAARWSVASGLHSRPALIHHSGVQRGVQVNLTAAGARALLGVPAAALAREIVDLADVVPGWRDLPAQLAGCPPARWSATVVQALAGTLARSSLAPARPEVTRALTLLGAGAPVQAVADDIGYTRRHLGTLVRAEVGLGPKELQRVARLERSRALLGRLPAAEVAARCGYADQSHLVREWTALAGCTPGTWVREELRFVQDVDELDG